MKLPPHAPPLLSFIAAGAGPQRARDVGTLRRAERLRLLKQRAAMSVADRHAASWAGAGAGLIVSAWWPIKAELSLRDYLTDLVARGAVVALPVVTAPHTPLVFRIWTPGCAMVQGVWKIPVPADGAEVRTDVALAPLVGWDGAGYRLGYGGGYFDRTLAALMPRAHAIGVGLNSARLTTIFPQPHDIAMHAIITETGVQTGP